MPCPNDRENITEGLKDTEFHTYQARFGTKKLGTFRVMSDISDQEVALRCERRNQSGTCWLAKRAGVCIKIIAYILFVSLLAACDRQGERVVWTQTPGSINNKIPTLSRNEPFAFPALVSLAVTNDGASIYAAGGNVLLRSGDGGKTWKEVARTQIHDIRSVVIAPDGSVVVVGSSIERYADEAFQSNLDLPKGLSKLTQVIVGPNGKLIAVGEGGEIVLSSDNGLTWKRVDSHTDKRITSIASHNETVVAVGVRGAIVRSSDGGLTWDVADSPTLRTLLSVTAAADGTLVAVGRGGAIVYSQDGGRVWKASKSIRRADLSSVIYVAGGSFVAVGRDATILRSMDHGVTWELALVGSYGHFGAVTSVPGGPLVAVGNAGMIERSIDGGATWSTIEADTSDSLRSVLFEPGGALVAVGSDGTIMRSMDGGITWVVVEGLAIKNFVSAVTGPGDSLIAVSDRGTILRSADGGHTWAMSAYRDTELLDVTAGRNGTLIAVGAEILRSIDGGNTWTPTAFDTSLTKVIAEPGGAFIAVGTRIFRSTDDGETWKATQGWPTETNEGLLRSVVVDAKGVLTAVGDAGVIVRSTDHGARWTLTPSGTHLDLEKVIAVPGGAMVAVGEAGVVVRSAYGKPWTEVYSDEQKNALRSVVADPKGSLIAVGESGTILRSRDGGETWSKPFELTETDLNDVVLDASGALVAVGNDALAIRSVDGGFSWGWLKNKDDDSDLWSAVLGPHGSLVAIGHGSVRVGERRDEIGLLAPTIQRIVQDYSLSGQPVLRITLDDVSRGCSDAKCVSIFARSSADQRIDANYRRVPDAAVSISESNKVVAVIDPSLLSATPGDPIHAAILISVPGYAKVYPSGDESLKVENHPNPFYEHWSFLTVSAVLAGSAIMYTLLAIKPLWILGLTIRPALLDAASRLGIPGVGDIIVGLFRALLLPLLARHPRVLNAWVLAHRDALKKGFETAAEGSAGRIPPYTVLPVDGPGGERIEPSPFALGRFFRSDRCCMQIIAPGGAGKTRLAIEIGRWFFSRELTTHPAAAIFIDEEFDDVFVVVQEKLKSLLPRDVPPPAFISALLSRGRLCIIVDRISERRQSTQVAITNLYRKASPKTLIGTTRLPIPIDSEVPIELRPRALDSSTLLSFLADQLSISKAGDLFPGLANQSALAQRLAHQITVDGQELDITPLLVRIFVVQAVELGRAQGIKAINELPANVPEAYFIYVEQLDATKRVLEPENVNGVNLVRRAAALIAYAELGEDFRPKPVRRADIDSAIQGDARLAASGVDWVLRMERNGLLVRKQVGAEEAIEYIIDPLAECLAAFQHARLCGGDLELWLNLISRVVARGGNAKGFMVALRMNHAAYVRELGFPPVTFPESNGVPAT